MRIQTETARSRIDTRNGTRQPYPRKSSALIEDWVVRMTSSDRNSPMVAVVWIQLV